jgi:hypothetical protein
MRDSLAEVEKSDYNVYTITIWKYIFETDGTLR